MGVPLLIRGLRMAARVAPGSAGGQIIYSRGSNQVWIDATFGRTEYQVDTGNAIRLEHTDRDFIVAAKDLILGGTLAKPERGDRITIVEDGNVEGQVFEVLPVDGQQCYRECDQFGVKIRVHTKRVS